MSDNTMDFAEEAARRGRKKRKQRDSDGFIRNDKGGLRPLVENIERAFAVLGVSLRRDDFAMRELIAGPADKPERGAQDHDLSELRFLMNQKFQFQPGKEMVIDTLITLARRRTFNPVLDMLAEAEAAWDGTARLDRMAVDYFNCADTKFSRAALRKWMIAAVRRVRQPGCKFDNILALESAEGWNKSGAFAVLAGQDHFSDESILHLRKSRDVMEQLENVWIHENPELAGMNKTEVEHVKAWASRQFDKDRMAFGRFSERRPRRSVESASTNADTYLQSQTGNRRFWPLKLLKAIDLAKLRRDRLQLWGEAARCESQGESIVLDEALWPAASKEQEKRRVTDPWEAILANMPDSVPLGGNGADDEERGGRQRQIVYDRGDGYEYVPSNLLLTFVLRVATAQQNKSHEMRVGEIMTLLGWERKRFSLDGRQVRAWRRATGDGTAAKANAELVLPLDELDDYVEAEADDE